MGYRNGTLAWKGLRPDKAIYYELITSESINIQFIFFKMTDVWLKETFPKDTCLLICTDISGSDIVGWYNFQRSSLNGVN